MRVDKYDKLSEDDKLWYTPDYLKYKITKVRDYQNCDLGYTHFLGWKEVSVPIGDPYRYIKVGAFEHNLRVVNKLLQPKITDSLLESNILMNRILNKKDWN